MAPLFLAPEGCNIKIKKIKAGKNLKKRLNDLGIQIGTVCEVIRGSKNCGIILKKDNNKIGIGFGMAAKILVEIF